MVRMTSDENTSTLLGSSHGPLELRVVGTQLAGQSVKLNSTKCTIGSSSRCTLRLQARRVEPVHCLILRGQNGTVVRRWSPHTRLNGASFTDALLQPGDRLTIGPIELDVVSTGQTPTASNPISEATPVERPASSADEAVSSAELARLRAELDEREIALMAREEAYEEQQASFAEQKSEWAATQAEIQAELAARREEHDALTHELNNLRQLQQDLPNLLENRQKQDDRRSEVNSDEKALAAAHAEFETKRSAQEATLDQLRRELDEQAASLEQARQELADDRAELEKKLAAAEVAFHEREAELNRRVSELESACSEVERSSIEQAKDLQLREQIWQDSQAAWAAERAVWNTSCHETSLELQRQQDELERQRNELAAEQEEFAIQREALEAATTAFVTGHEPTEREHNETLTDANSAIDKSPNSEQPSIADLFDAEQEEACDEEAFESSAADEPASTWDKPSESSAKDLHLHEEIVEEHEAEEQAEAEEDHSEPASEVASIADQSRAEEPEIDEKRAFSLAEQLLGKHLPEEPADEEDVERELRSRSEMDDEHESSEAVAESDAGINDHYAAEPEPPAFEAVAKASPAESSGLMEKLRAMTGWEDEEEQEDQASNLQPTMPTRSTFEPISPVSSSSSIPNVGSPSPLGASGGSSANADDDEESIEDYMAKLMTRVRGSDPAPALASQRFVPQPKPIPEPVAEESPVELKAPTTPAEPFEMAPRHMPTELTSNLAAMRELANFSARDAIDTSVRNRWWQAAVGKFSVAGVAIVSAVALLIWTRNPQSIQFIGAGIAVLIAIFWGLQGMIMLRNVRKANELLAEKAKQPIEDVAKMREMLYSESEDLDFDPNKKLEPQGSTESPALDTDGEIVEIESSVDSESAKSE